MGNEWLHLAFTCHLEVEFHNSIVRPLKKIRTSPQLNRGKMLALHTFVVPIYAITCNFDSLFPVVANVEDGYL